MALAQGWNERPSQLLEQRAGKRKSLVSLSVALLLAAVASLVVAQYSVELVRPFGVSLGALTRTLSSLLGYAGAALFGALGLQNLFPPAAGEASWQRSLNDGQRRLLGLGPGPGAKAKAASAAGGGAVGSPFTPLGPPLRGGKAAAIAATPPTEGGAAQYAGGGAASAGRSGGGRGASPFPGRQASTPVQLQQLMDEFEQDTQAAAAAAAAPSDGGYSPFGYGAPYGSPVASPAEARGRLGAAGGGLALGPAAPTYRPSAVRKGTAALPHRPDGRVQASSEEAVDAVLKQLGTSDRHVEVCRERLREWLASAVLQPLVKAVDGAHADVVDAAARLGWAGLQLSPLTEALVGASGGTASRAGALASTERASKARSALQADDEVLIKQMQDHLLGRVHALPPTQQPPGEVVACLKALDRYQKLAALLRGEFPAGLLPPAPPGYLVERIRELAGGPCLQAFTWNNGGSFGGKAWSEETPTDSALLLYVFAAFLAAPHWDFPKDEVMERGPAGPLYLGKLPTRVADEYFAILSYRPPPAPQGTGIVGLLLGGGQPHFSLLLRGDTVLTLTEQFGVMHIIIFLILYCKQHTDGFLGPRSLQYLGLQQVTRPADFRFMFGTRLFGLW